MGKCIIAQGKTPISSESVERNEFVEKDIIRYREHGAGIYRDKKCTAHNVLRILPEYIKEPVSATGSLYILLISND